MVCFYYVFEDTFRLDFLVGMHDNVGTVITPGRAGQKDPVLEKNASNRLVHNLFELISKGHNPTDLAPKSQQPSCNFPGKQIKILSHNLYVD